MAYSKVDICNTALALLGESPIRSLEDENTRASLCNQMYAPVRDYLLFKFDWGFARRLSKLQRLLDFETPPLIYPYEIPANCRIVRELYPHGSREWWEVMGRVFLCRKFENVYIYYTTNDAPETHFSDAFAFLFSLGLAVKLGPPLTQNNQLSDSLFKQFKIEEREAWAADADQSNDYKPIDGLPEYDTFVNPDLRLSLIPESVPENR